MSVLMSTPSVQTVDSEIRPPVILIADDEPLIRELLDRCLQGAGFNPLLASSGEEALEIYRRCGSDVSLVLLDVCMPGLSGPQTLEELKGINPEVRCCFMSGNLGRYHPDDLVAAGALQLISKPFLPTELIASLRHLTSASA